MDYDKIITGTATKEVKNPAYNAKSKKNKQPKTLIVPATRQDEEGSYFGDFNRAFKDATIYSDIPDSDKYVRAGITISKIDRPYLDKFLSDKQSGFTKVFNGLAQAVVSEIGIGTIKSVSDIVDSVGQLIGVSDKDYTNPVSSYLEGLQNDFKAATPIYTNPDAPDIFHGGLASAGWWASNLPSVASTLMLLIPSKLGVTAIKGITGLTRINKLARNTVRFASGLRPGMKASDLTKAQRFLNSRSTIQATNAILEHGVQAGLMRTIENYQEARQVYNQAYGSYAQHLNNMTDEEYNNFIANNRNLDGLKDINGNQLDLNDRDAVAKAIASNAADTTFKLDFINTGFDLFQLYALRNFGKLSKTTAKKSAKVNRANKENISLLGKTEEEIAESVAKDAKWYQKFGSKTADMFKGLSWTSLAEFTEGVEEAVNYVAQEEGIHYGNVLLGTEKADNFWDDRMSRYLKAPELYDSAFWGVLGGVAFHYLGSAQQAIARKIEATKNRKKLGNVDEELPWYDFGEDSEIAGRLTDISQRSSDLEQYSTAMKSLKSNKHPTNGSTITQAESEMLQDQLTNEFIQNLTLRAARNGNLKMLREFIGAKGMAKEMVNKGVFDNEADAMAHQTKLLDKIDQVDKLFDKHMARLEAVSAALEANRGSSKAANLKDVTKRIDAGKGKTPVFAASDIPLEYLMMIADRNVRNELSIEDYKKDRDDYLNEAHEELNELIRARKIDSSLNYEQTIRLGVYAHRLGILESKKEDLENSDAAKTLSGQFAIDNVNREIDTMHRLIGSLVEGMTPTEINLKGDALTVENVANYLWARTRAAKYMTVGENKEKLAVANTYRSGVTKRLDDWIVNSLGATLSSDNKTITDITKLEDLEIPGIGSLRGKGISSTAVAQQMNILDAAHQQLFNSEQVKLAKLAPVVNEKLQQAATAETMIASANANIIQTSEEVANEIAKTHNEMVEARSQAINKALDSLTALVAKYIKDDTSSPVESNAIRNIAPLQYLDKVFVNENAADSILNEMSDADKALWRDSLKVINLTSTSNASLGRQVADILERRVKENERQAILDMIRHAEDADVEDTEDTEEEEEGSAEEGKTKGEGSTTSETSIQGGKQAGSNDNTSPQQQRGKRQANRQKIKIIDGVPHIGIAIKEDGSITYINPDATSEQEDNVTKYSVPLVKDDKFDNLYHLDLVGKEAQFPKLVTNEELFVIHDASVDGGVVRNNPVLQTDGVDNSSVSIQDKGDIAKPDRVLDSDDNNGEPETKPDPAGPAVDSGTGTAVIGQGNKGGVDTGGTPAEIASTGGQQVSDQYSDDDIANGVAIQDVRDNFNSELKKATTEEQVDALVEEYKAKLANVGASEPEINSFIVNVGKIHKRILALRASKSNLGSFATLVDTLIIETQFGLNSRGIFDDHRDFRKALDAALEGYCNLVGTNTINGKKYIVLQDFLRYCYRVTESDLMGDILFNAVKSYIQAEDKRANNNESRNLVDYVFVDKNRIDDSGYLKETKITTRKALDTERSDDRVDILKALREADDDSKKKIQQDLEKLETNDTLIVVPITETVQRGKETYTNRRIALKASKKGPIIGYLPVPQVKGHGFEYAQMGWLVDLAKTTTHDTVSRFIDAVTNIIGTETEGRSPEATRLRDLLYSIAFDDNKEKERADKVKEAIELIENPTVGLTEFFEEDDNSGDDTTRVQYLVNILAYVKRTDVVLDDDAKDRVIDNSIATWANKVYRAWSLANDLHNAATNDPATTVKVTKVANGVPRFTNKPGSEQYPRTALTPTVKKTARVCVQTFDSGIVDDEGVTHEIKPWTNGTTKIAIKQGDSWSYVNTWAQPLFGNNSTKFVKDFRNAILDEVNRLLSNFDYEEIKKFFNNLCMDKGALGSSIAMLSGVNFVHLRNDVGFKITWNEKGTTKSITFFKNPRENGRRVIAYNDGNKSKYREIAKKKDAIVGYITDALKQAKFNYAFSHITSSTVNEGFLIKDANGITIKVGKFEKKYKSYKQFLFDSGICKISIEKKVDATGKESNFKSILEDGVNEDNVRLHQYLRIDMSPSTSPVEENEEDVEDNKKIAERPFVDVKEEVDAILNDTSDDAVNDGQELVSIIEPDIANALTPIEYNGELVSLFPDSLSVDRSLAELAKTESSNGKVTIGSSLYGMLLSLNPNIRKGGIRLLIHEKLHILIADKSNAKKLKAVQEIHSIFVDYCRKNPTLVDDYVKNFIFGDEYKANMKAAGINLSDKQYTNDDGTLTDKGLEEFLIYSLTDKKLAEQLNKITVENEKVEKPQTLLQKIMQVLADIFGWGVHENTLYAKEFNVLRDIFENVPDANMPNQSENKKEPDNVEPDNNQENEEEEDEEDEENEEDEEDSSFATISEYSSELDGEKTISIEFDRAELPINERYKFDKLVKKGIIYEVCN